MRACDLRTEYHDRPIGMDETSPRLTWRIAGGRKQTAFEAEIIPEGASSPCWSSGERRGDDTWIVCPGGFMRSFTAYSWRVRVRDEKNRLSPWSVSGFETGLLDSPWPARWITGDGAASMQAPPLNFRREFTVSATPARARLYITALGVYRPWINGRRITENTLMPGFTAYQKRVQYQCYDITETLKPGCCTVAVEVAEGWYKGVINRYWNNGMTVWGDRCALLAFVRLEYPDGSAETVGTDASWSFTDHGPYRQSDIYNGEIYDARLRDDSWKLPGGGRESHWLPAEEIIPDVSGTPNYFAFASGFGPGRRGVVPEIQWNSGEAVRAAEIMPVKRIRVRRDGRILCDFGQNITGRERIRISAPRDRRIVIRHGEMLNPDGSLYTANLRSARAESIIYCDGSAFDYEPEFTFYGFRYLEITGWEGDLSPEDVKAAVIHSDMRRTGRFRCSSKLLNRLYENTVWGNRDNYLDIPTDCPQRDERMGWTGDVQVFIDTAAYHYDIASFFTKWLIDLDASAHPGGAFPAVAPIGVNSVFRNLAADPGWSDAGVICPWTLYTFYGDREFLARHYPAMRRHVESMRRDAPGLIRNVGSFGDHLAVEPTPIDLICTAFFAHSTDLLARSARVLGKRRDAAGYRRLFEEIREAYRRRFYPDGRNLSVKTQTAALLSLRFELAPEDGIQSTAEWLAEDVVKKHGTHLSTGFLGTPYILEELSRHGCGDTAYALLNQTSYPGWLYSVVNGATTTWERWNSWTRETGFGDISMNSFNHYAYGSVASWFYNTIAGIRPLESAPGFKLFEIAPLPGGGLTYARAEYDSPAGLIRSAWRRNADGSVTYRFTIPANTEALVRLPGMREMRLPAGKYSRTVGGGK